MSLRTSILATALAIGVAPAFAADRTLDDAQLDALLTGNTVYIAVPPGPAGGPEGGTAPFRYGADGKAAAKLPAGMTLVGTWSIRDGQYCADWDNGPKGSCTAIIKTDTGYNLVDKGKANAVRGTIEKIVPGNPENL